MSFKKSKGVGRKGERKVFDLLNSLGFECEFNKEFKKNAWDLSFDYGSRKITCEVKNDLFSVLTGNIAIEYHNPKQGKPSGLFYTTADIWFHIIPNRAIYVNTVKALKDFVATHEPCKTFEKGGDDNANLKLYKLSRIVGYGLYTFPEDDIEKSLLLLEKLLEE